MKANNRILVIDDNPAIHDDFRKILCPQSKAASELAASERILLGESFQPSESSLFEVDTAFQGQEGLEKVRQAVQAGRPYALAFVDIRMPPGWDGVETISRIWQLNPELQIVICTAYSDYSWDEISRELSSSDNLLILKKPFDNIEVLQLAHALTRKWTLTQQAAWKLNDLEAMVEQRTKELHATNEQLRQEIQERKMAEASLRHSEERFSRAFRACPIPMAIFTLEESRFLDINERFVRLVGLARDQIVGRSPAELRVWVEPPARMELFEKLRSERSVNRFPCRIRTRAGELRESLVWLELFELERQPHVLAITEDVSERIRLETKLKEAQKMEAVGRLAAGIAHDFNNILTIIEGHASLSLATSLADPQVRESNQQILLAAERAAKFTRQLLAFSRQQLLEFRDFDPNKLVAGLLDMLSRLVGEHIHIQVQYGENLPCLHADQNNIGQVLIHLAANARDAMPRGGELTIRTEVIELDDTCTRQNPEASPGRFICLTVTDTGCGIDSEVKARMFEPFFTTKDIGQGTGMGLAISYGIVKQHQGWMQVSSSVGQGSTFKVFLPVRPRLDAVPSDPSAP